MTKNAEQYPKFEETIIVGGYRSWQVKQWLDWHGSHLKSRDIADMKSSGYGVVGIKEKDFIKYNLQSKYGGIRNEIYSDVITQYNIREKYIDITDIADDIIKESSDVYKILKSDQASINDFRQPKYIIENAYQTETYHKQHNWYSTNKSKYPTLKWVQLNLTNVSVGTNCNRCGAILSTTNKSHFKTQSCMIVDEIRAVEKDGWVALPYYLKKGRDGEALRSYGAKSISNGEVYIKKPYMDAYEQFVKLKKEKSSIVMDGSKPIQLKKWLDQVSGNDSSVLGKCSMRSCNLMVGHSNELTVGTSQYRLCEAHAANLERMLSEQTDTTQ